MAKPKSQKNSRPKNVRKSTAKSQKRALNAFNAGIDDNTYITGTRQQQDIDLEDIADKRIKALIDGTVKQEDDEELDSDELLGSESDYGLNNGEPDSDWGDSLDEGEMVSLSAAWDMASDEEWGESKASKSAKVVEVEEAESDLDLDSDVEPEAKAEGAKGARALSLSSDEDADSESEELSDAESEAESDASDSDGSDSLDSDSDDDANPALLKAISKISDSGSYQKTKLDKSAGPERASLPSSSRRLGLGDLTGTHNLKLMQSKAKSLEMPLPASIQAEGDRAAAYELANAEVSKWEDTVKEMRRADTLSFPINAPPQREAANVFVAPREQNELEQKVDDLLKESHIKDEAALSAFEHKAPSALTFEEMKARRQELRMMRELMFREEQKAKRIKKIKSKSYRRVHKKDRLKMQELEGEGEEPDADDLDRARALERASLKHKTTSKWARRMIDTGMSKDASTRSELEAMLQQGEEMRKRVRGGDDSGSESEGGSDFAGFEDKPQPALPAKSIMNMKFMKAAPEVSDSDDSDAAPQGRRSYAPALDDEVEKRAQAEAEIDDEKSLTNKLSKRQKKEPKDEIVLKYNDDSEPQAEAEADPSNPWLNLSAQKNKSTFQTASKDSSRNHKAQDKLRRSKNADANVSIALEDTLDATLQRSDQLSFDQQQLIRKAFAGDDVAAEFEKEKAAAVEDEGTKLVDETLPGWGSWGGDGLKPKVQRFRRVEGVDGKKRKDYGKDGVLINEKVNKKVSKYAASAVPFPYENAAQYERSLRTPIGNEWATRDTFQRQTRPRVTVKKGEIIDPIKRK